eukprot:TRINITY_DN25746_c0_g1_i1.p1 TRINITY_DN25746_c0_g1~~TRINITY_DN25746_c0_g1_i1.p1  ORF type:complete len:233 (+),score=38.92 TRINITY_DN25746_c0_g1_i1:50-700(+)
MPKRGYQPNSHIYRRHWVWRTDPEFQVKDEWAGGAGTPKFKRHKKPSRWVRGDRFRTMRMNTGGSGWNACYKPMVVEKKEVQYSAAPADDFLKLPEKGFFALHTTGKNRNGLTKLQQTTLALPPTQRATPLEYAMQPITRKASSYSGHLKSPPTHFTHTQDGGQVPPEPNVVQREKSGFENEAYLSSLKDALRLRDPPATGQETNNNTGFFRVKAM